MAERILKETELRALLEVSKRLHASIDLESLLKLVVDLSLQVMEVEAASLLLVDPNRNDLYFQVVDGEKVDQLRTVRIAMGEGLAGWVAQHGQPVVVNDVASDPRFTGRIDHSIGFVTRSILAVPIQHDGKIVGVLELLNKRGPGPFGEHDLELAELMAGQIAVAIETAHLHRRILESERLAAVGQAVAGLAHCIKNILTGITGGAQIFDKALANNQHERMLKGWDMVRRSNQRMFDLVMDMLSYSKERLPEYALTDVNELCVDVRDLMAPKAGEKAVRVETELDPSIGQVLIDPKGIHRCVLNLVSNAVDACEREQASVRIRTQNEPEPGGLVIAVHDEGVGISTEDKQKLFRAFFSTKGSKGTGLGLPVAYKIIREHGGQIDVESEVGKGSTFLVRLPKQPPAAPAS